MDHYVLILDWATQDAKGVEVIGVAHSLEEAKETFKKAVVEEKEYATTNGYEIFDDEDTIFNAGKSGYLCVEYTKLYIQGVWQ